MAVNASPISQEDLCHTVYGVTAIQAGTTSPRSVVSGAGGTSVSDEPSRSSSSQIVTGVPLPSLTPTTSCVHISKRQPAASIGVNVRVDLQGGAEKDSSTLQHGSASCQADVELRQDDLFTVPTLDNLHGKMANQQTQTHTTD